MPSTNELAAFHRINPATAAKGVNQLVDDGILYKRRGIGMFVTSGAREKLRDRRREEFADQFVSPLVTEAAKLGIDRGDLKKMIDDVGGDGHDGPAVAVRCTASPSGSAASPRSTTSASTSRENRIYGLLGRNGAGKTTLMQILTGAGVRHRGRGRGLRRSRRYENDGVLRRICFIKESQRYPDSTSGSATRSPPAALVFPNWDERFAAVPGRGLRAAGRAVRSRSSPGACSPRSASSSASPPGRR